MTGVVLLAPVVFHASEPLPRQSFLRQSRAVSCADIRGYRRFHGGRLEVDVQLSTDFNNGFELVFERINPADPPRNVRVLTPGFADRAEWTPFHPYFIESLQKYKVCTIDASRFVPSCTAVVVCSVECGAL
jgi:hypothetical protein